MSEIQTQPAPQSPGLSFPDFDFQKMLDELDPKELEAQFGIENPNGQKNQPEVKEDQEGTPLLEEGAQAEQDYLELLKRMRQEQKNKKDLEKLKALNGEKQQDDYNPDLNLDEDDDLGELEKKDFKAARGAIDGQKAMLSVTNPEGRIDLLCDDGALLSSKVTDLADREALHQALENAETTETGSRAVWRMQSSEDGKERVAVIAIYENGRAIEKLFTERAKKDEQSGKKELDDQKVIEDLAGLVADDLLDEPLAFDDDSGRAAADKVIETAQTDTQQTIEDGSKINTEISGNVTGISLAKDPVVPKENVILSALNSLFNEEMFAEEKVVDNAAAHFTAENHEITGSKQESLGAIETSLSGISLVESTVEPAEIAPAQESLAQVVEPSVQIIGIESASATVEHEAVEYETANQTKTVPAIQLVDAKADNVITFEAPERDKVRQSAIERQVIEQSAVERPIIEQSALERTAIQQPAAEVFAAEAPIAIARVDAAEKPETSPIKIADLAAQTFERQTAVTETSAVIFENTSGIEITQGDDNAESSPVETGFKASVAPAESRQQIKTAAEAIIIRPSNKEQIRRAETAQTTTERVAIREQRPAAEKNPARERANGIITLRKSGETSAETKGNFSEITASRPLERGAADSAVQLEQQVLSAFRNREIKSTGIKTSAIQEEIQALRGLIRGLPNSGAGARTKTLRLAA